ncbi:Uncharacterised protein [Clostridium tertium]|uniref:Uncharacterized protein n=1 Tax=Clostridium tertium TaxID=1559 RepID=A0A6N3GHV3_9CLOT
MRFPVRKIKYEVLSSSALSKTCVFFENWITMPFFRGNLRKSIS